MHNFMKTFRNISRLLSIVLIIGFISLRTMGGCSDNNSGSNSTGNEGGDDGLGSSFTGIFPGGQFGLDYSWTSISRCRNNRDMSNDGCDVNAAFVNNPSDPMPACTGSPNPFCTLDECVDCY